MNEKYEAPDLSDVPTADLCDLMLVCAFNNDPSDRFFAAACRDETAKRKPATEPQGGE